MSEAIQKIEIILKSEYSTPNFVEFVTEIFDSLKIVAPDKFHKEYSNFSSHIEGYTHIGDYISSDDKKVAVFSVQLKTASYVENSRSTQRSYVRKLIDAGNCDAAIVSFYSPSETKWRLSFVRLDYEMKFDNGRFKTTENLTPAKRYSFLVGRDEPCHTAISRFHNFIIDKNYNPSLDEIEEAFSVEKVTKEFFELYCEKFYQLQEYLDSNQDFVDESKKCGFTSEQFAKKLMGQIVFLYFLQKKGWLGVSVWPSSITEKEFKKVYYTSGAQGRIIKEHFPKLYVKVADDEYRLNSRVFDIISDNDEEVIANSMPRIKTWGDGSKKFLRTIYDWSQKHGGHFYEEYLEPLFYNSLNRNRGPLGYCPELHCRVPFLSGGLFDPIDNYDWKSNYFDIPDEMFSNKKNENDREGTGILDIFDRYNFTMSEDEPMEREVAIDPEMLGKVFENLLEVKDRKSKGAFYTPREIVHYMCQESLINYLVRKTGAEEEDIRDFILYGDFMKDEDTSKEKREGNGGMYISENLFKIDDTGNVVVNKLKEIDDALATVRVADPAVGSGAFPLGMMNEIVRARQNITAYLAIGMNAYDKRFLMQNQRSPYFLKRHTIKNSLFAVDIEPSAVDIAQLRLWLSLVIDDEINPKAQNDFEGHQNPLPLPNLECNILCGNSLVDEFMGIKLVKESNILGTMHGNVQLDLGHARFEAVVQKLLEEQDKLFYCDDTIKKEELKKNIQSYKDIIIEEQLRYSNPEVKEAYEEAKKLSSKPFTLWQLDFARVFRDNGGFDIVIGNPPWGASLSKIEKEILKQKYPEIDSSTTNSFAYFIGLAYRLYKSSIAFVLPDSVLIKDYSKTRKLICDNLSEVIWYQNCSVPFNNKPFKSVEHDVCTIHVINERKNSTIHVVTNQWIDDDYLRTEDFFDQKEIIYPQFDYAFNLKIHHEDIPILAKLLKDTPLSNTMQCHEGIHSGNVREKLFKKEYEPNYKPLYYGGGAGDIISTYYSKRSGWYVDYRKEVIDKKKGEYASLRDEAIFINPKVYITRTGNPFKAFFDNDSYASNNFFSLQMIDMATNNEENLLCVLPFINSKVCQYFIRVFAAPRLGNTFIETKIVHLLKLPIPSLADKQKKELVLKVSELISIKKNNMNDKVDEKENEINQMIYDLYNLSADEIAIIERNVV